MEACQRSGIGVYPILSSTETPPHPEPGAHPPSKSKKEEDEVSDPNITNSRFNINRPCIYERRLPGNAYITAHDQRLQHDFYSTPALSDNNFDHVDFLAISFVFHSPDTLNHRFKAATIRASLHGPNHSSSSHTHTKPKPRSRSRPRSRLHSSRISPKKPIPTPTPIFLMHAPHTLSGPLSPETLQWGYSLSGSLGVAPMPIIASLSPAAGLNGRFRRYEMMRIQGSVRTTNGNPASQIVWTLEENTLQRSGLPREFTFVMLIAKHAARSRVGFGLEVEPVLQGWCGWGYPRWWLRLGFGGRYKVVSRERVDFRVSVGQRFGSGSKSGNGEIEETLSSRRGFNFVTLVGRFEEYVDFPGRIRLEAGFKVCPSATDRGALN
ncbi:hypothetical protein BDW59DRAFT_159827 [Aspergillus cavernicola]|uniref:Uncharacterized protein n=1 Tax=Aspergillus cavernicola TaxID=176166 RepID=A0ABR4IKH7_9EURO